MKPPTYKNRRLVVRIKPGGFLRIPLSFLHRSGWRAGDVLIFEAAGGCIRIIKPPTETVWRIERLRLRIGSGSADESPSFAARTYGEYLSMTVLRSGPFPSRGCKREI